MLANKKTLALALASVSLMSAATANTLDLTFVDKDRSTVLSTTFTTAYDTGRLEFRNTQSNTSFYAFCVELSEDHAEATDGPQSYTLGMFTGLQATRLQGLFSTSYAGLANAHDRAAFQTAVWEITHETAANMDVSADAGIFSVIGLGHPSSTPGFVLQVNTMLGNASSYAGPDLYSLTKLTHGEFQDLLTVTAVPEPGGFALMAAGLAGFGLIARRRANKQS